MPIKQAVLVQSFEKVAQRKPVVIRPVLVPAPANSTKELQEDGTIFRTIDKSDRN